MTDLIRGSCRDAPHLARGWLISRAANGPTATISLRLEQKHEVMCVVAADELTAARRCLCLLKNNSFKKINDGKVINSMRTYLHFYPFISEN